MKQSKVDEVWSDLVTEEEVIQKLGYTQRSLQKLRKNVLVPGVDWVTMKGRKPMYLKSRLLQKLNILEPIKSS